MKWPTNSSLSIKLLESDKQIQQKIYKALAYKINQAIKKNREKITTTFKTSIKSWVGQQPEIASLLATGAMGSLNAHFGLPVGDSDYSVKAIIAAVSDSLRVNIKPLDRNLKGNIEFNFQQSDFLNLLGLSEGHVRTIIGADLHWLDWLLLKGDTIVVVGYHYTPGNTGRSGGGIMDIGGAWRVPPRFSGSADNNFITRSFQGREKEITRILEGLFT